MSSRLNGKYSVILPVRNGGKYVKDCVTSILAQTYEDFRLEVLDNCSTDGTLEWITSIDDERIRIYASDRPLTIGANWARATTIPKNEFITLIGHDDILDSHYLETMDSLIRKHPEATLYQAHFRYIDSEGSLIRHCRPMDEIQSASEFVAFILSGIIDTMGTGFMMRSAHYDREGGIPTSYPNLLFADFHLFINLTRLSYKATSPEECFAFRLHRSTTTLSGDNPYQEAYGLFIDYLEKLKEIDPHIQQIVTRYAMDFIRQYSKGLVHRLLRTPISKRGGRTVNDFLAQNAEYADRLVPGNSYRLDRDFSIRLARQIDSNPIFRNLFLAFKRIYSRPIY